MSKKYLKGFSNFGYFKVTEDTADNYNAATERKRIPSARSCSPTDNRTDFSIPGDDGVWDSGSEWKDTTSEITFNEFDLETLADLTGAKVNEDGSIDEGILDNAPTVAINYSALRADGGYRLYCYFSSVATNIKVSHTTKSENTDAQSYTITFKHTPRKLDGVIRRTIDIAKGEKLDWLNTVNVVQETQNSEDTE